jgi:hypothetical protein
VCDGIASTVCIEKVYKLSGGSYWKELKWKTDFGSAEVPANVELGIPHGTSASFWSDTSDNNGLVVAATISYNGMQAPLSPTSFHLVLLPAVLQTTGALPGSYIHVMRNGSQHIGWTVNNDCPTQISGNSYCAKFIDFESDSRYRLVLHVPEKLSNWLFGRLGNVEVSQEKISENLVKLDVAANVTKVVQISGQVDANDPSLNGWGNQMQAGSKTWFTPDSPFLMTLVKLSLKLGEPTPLSERSVWDLNSLPQSVSFGNSPCSGSGIVGIVSTDAPVYEASSPRLVDNEIRYQLAGSHLDLSGNVLRSNYRMLLSRTVAKCLYPASALNPKASISVVGSSESQYVATAVTKLTDEWVVMNVNGLTFSAPEIRIKLEPSVTPLQPIEPGVTPSPTGSPSTLPTESKSAANKPSPTAIQEFKTSKRLIACVKGKIIKKVSSAKCPIGFKLK